MGWVVVRSSSWKILGRVRVREKFEVQPGKKRMFRRKGRGPGEKKGAE